MLTQIVQCIAQLTPSMKIYLPWERCKCLWTGTRVQQWPSLGKTCSCDNQNEYLICTTDTKQSDCNTDDEHLAATLNMTQNM